jgi:hypothetical protein
VGWVHFIHHKDLRLAFINMVFNIGISQTWMSDCQILKNVNETKFITLKCLS